MMDEQDDYECTSVVFVDGGRCMKTYPLTEIELNLLCWLPCFARRRLVKRIMEETKFHD